MWHIYGKKYDLTRFLDKHPGGKDILLKTRSSLDEPNAVDLTVDLTPLFESYHAFSDMDKIKNILSKYEVVDYDASGSVVNTYTKFTFDTYHELVQRIKPLFPDRASVKAPATWHFQVIITVCLYVTSFYYAAFSNYVVWLRCVLGVLAGIGIESLAFTCMHDSSHYAVTQSPRINWMVSKLTNSWILWNSNLWFRHHVLHHHSFTGMAKDAGTLCFDPDLYHLYPFANKLSMRRSAPFYQNVYTTFGFACIFPGMHLGQALIYLYSTRIGRLFGIKLPSTTHYTRMDWVIMFANMYCLYRAGIAVTMAYILAMNLCYSINVFFDHDTFESAVENHCGGTGMDWARMQIMHSGNFLNGSWVWTRLFGGINYQIEHHLFPNMSHVYYPVIAPIVREFCREKGIPYVHHPTLASAFRSYMKMLRFRNELQIKN